METGLFTLLGTTVGVIGTLLAQWISARFNWLAQRRELTWGNKVSAYSDFVSAHTLFASAPGELERLKDYLRAYFRVKLIASEPMIKAMAEIPIKAQRVYNAFSKPDPVTFQALLMDWLDLGDNVEKLMSQDLQASLR